MVLLYVVYTDTCRTNKEMFTESKNNDKIKEMFTESKNNDKIDEDNNPFVRKSPEVIPPWLLNQYSGKKYDIDMLDDGMNGNATLTFNMCSKACCSTQYPPPIDLPVDPLVCNSKQKFVSSSYTCNNGLQDSGCVCMTEDQAELFARRGNNI